MGPVWGSVSLGNEGATPGLPAHLILALSSIAQIKGRWEFLHICGEEKNDATLFFFFLLQVKCLWVRSTCFPHCPHPSSFVCICSAGEASRWRCRNSPCRASYPFSLPFTMLLLLHLLPSLPGPSAGAPPSLCDLSTAFMPEELPSVTMSTDEVSGMLAAAIRHDMF